MEECQDGNGSAAYIPECCNTGEQLAASIGGLTSLQHLTLENMLPCLSAHLSSICELQTLQLEYLATPAETVKGWV